MGLLGSYVVRLRCDHWRHKGPRQWREFYADNLTHGLRDARQLGWKYNNRSDVAICPRCALKQTLKVQKGGLK